MDMEHDSVLDRRLEFYQRSRGTNESERSYAAGLVSCYDQAFPEPAVPDEPAADAPEESSYRESFRERELFRERRKSAILTKIMSGLSRELQRSILSAIDLSRFEIDHVQKLLPVEHENAPDEVMPANRAASSEPTGHAILETTSEGAPAQPEARATLDLEFSQPEAEVGDSSTDAAGAIHQKSQVIESTDTENVRDRRMDQAGTGDDCRFPATEVHRSRGRGRNISKPLTKEEKHYFTAAMSKTSAILVYTDASECSPKEAELFKFHCEKLSKVLTEKSVTNARKENIRITSTKELHTVFENFIFEFEQEIMRNACDAICEEYKHTLRPGYVKAALLMTYATCRKKEAQDSLEKYKCIFANNTSVFDDVLDFVADQWMRLHEPESFGKAKTSSFSHKVLEIAEKYKIDKNIVENVLGRVEDEFCSASGFALRRDALNKECEFVSTLCKNLRRKNQYDPSLVVKCIMALNPLNDRTIWLYYCGHLIPDGSGVQDIDPSWKSWLKRVGNLVSNGVSIIQCCHAAASLAIPKINIFEKDKYAGYFGIACVSSDKKEYLHYGFIDVVERAISCAVRRCTAEEATNKAKPCPSCQTLRDEADDYGCVRITDICEYIQFHMRRDFDVSVIDGKFGKSSQLPVALRRQDPMYNIIICVRTSVDKWLDHIDVHLLPSSLQEMNCQVLLRVLEMAIWKKNPVIRKKIAKSFACPLTGCNGKHPGKGKEQLLSFVSCIIRAYKQFESQLDNANQSDRFSDGVQTVLTETLPSFLEIYTDSEERTLISIHSIDALKAAFQNMNVLYYSIRLPSA